MLTIKKKTLDDKKIESENLTRFSQIRYIGFTRNHDLILSSWLGITDNDPIALVLRDTIQ